jgi:DNA-binding XRE family transcriptional regulator
MPVQNITLNKQPFALVPRAEFEELVARAAGEKLPAFPRRDRRGNYPATAAIRVAIARDIITSRIAAGWTQQQLAKRAGVSAETISRLEGGKHKPQAATMEKIDAVLKKAGV